MTRHDTKKRVITIATSIFVLILLIYVIFQGRDILFGVRLQTNLESVMTVPDDTVEVVGTARHAVRIAVNGYTIPVSEKGTFTTTIALLPGTNNISVLAENKFRKNTEKTYTIYHVPPHSLEEGTDHGTMESLLETNTQ